MRRAVIDLENVILVNHSDVPLKFSCTDRPAYSDSGYSDTFLAPKVIILHCNLKYLGFSIPEGVTLSEEVCSRGYFGKKIDNLSP